jgi:tRNA A58 N-methylase Trm61
MTTALFVALVPLFVTSATLLPQPAGAITPARIFEALGVQDGFTVCEMGAGDGELSIAAARQVGPNGHVYTSELGDDRVKSLKDKMAKSGLAQITVVAGDPVKTNFPDAACDALFLRNVYHHFAEPFATNASIAAALKPGARLAVIDFTPPPGHEAPRPADRGKDGMHGVTPPTLSRELSAAGFVPVSDYTANRDFMIVVSKPKG